MRTRWKILIGLTVFVILATGLALVTLRLQPQSELDTYKQSLRAKGEKLTLSEVLPPPVPLESNSVNVVQAAFGMLGSSSNKIPEMMKMVAPGKALIGWQQPEARGDDFTNSWAEFTADVETNRPMFELLQHAMDYPRLDFQLDYGLGLDLPLQHLFPMKRAMQRLAAAAICNLHDGNSAAATTNITIMVGLVQKNEAEGVLISHLVRLAITAIAVAPTWELLQTTNVTDEQLARLQKGWETLDFFRDAEYAFTMERWWLSDLIQKSRTSHENFEKVLGMVASMSSSGSSSSIWSWPPDWEAITESPRYAVAEKMWRSSWSYSSELQTLKIQQIGLEAVRTMRTNQSQFYKADYEAMLPQLKALGGARAGSAFFSVLKIPDYRGMIEDSGVGMVVQKAISAETARRMVVAAIALKRFQLQHGHQPETLTALVPEYLSAVPIDPQDGQSLRYHPNADGTYLLYSVGEDGKDDGGDPTSTASGSSSLFWLNPRARDWVWPQPATAAEIQYFREHPPK